eukprot:205692-Hanusia_phi.AAC.1
MSLHKKTYFLGPTCPRCGNPSIDDQDAFCIFCLEDLPDQLLACPDCPTVSSPAQGKPQDFSVSSADKKKTRWCPDAKERHSHACTGKLRLDFEDKVEIVKRYYLSPSSSKGRRAVSQLQLARIYGKSRAAISKILKPDYALGVVASLDAAGGDEKERYMLVHSIQEELRRKCKGNLSDP